MIILFLINGDAQKGDIFVLIVALKFVKSWNFCDTGATPGCPNININIFSRKSVNED